MVFECFFSIEKNFSRIVCLLSLNKLLVFLIFAYFSHFLCNLSMKRTNIFYNFHQETMKKRLFYCSFLLLKLLKQCYIYVNCKNKSTFTLSV